MAFLQKLIPARPFAHHWHKKPFAMHTHSKGRIIRGTTFVYHLGSSVTGSPGNPYFISNPSIFRVLEAPTVFKDFENPVVPRFFVTPTEWTGSAFRLKSYLPYSRSEKPSQRIQAFSLAVENMYSSFSKPILQIYTTHFIESYSFVNRKLATMY